MIKDLTAEVKRDRTRSRSRSTRRSRRRDPSRDRRYSPSSNRSGSRRRRSRSGGRRISSRRTSSRRHSRRRRSRSSTRSTSSRRRDRRSSSPRGRAPAHAAQPAAAAYPDPARVLAQQYPQIGNPTGKRLSRRRLTLEPYRSLPPDLKTRASERRSRRDLTFPEHVCGAIRMLFPTIDPLSEPHAVLKHLSQVAEDAAILPWAAVREACMAHIEDGDATWHDQELFTNDRTKLSWIKGRQLESSLLALCPDFNAGVCKEKATHSDQGRTWTHECAQCLYITGDHRTSHGASACRTKATYKPNDEGRHDFRQKGQHYKKKDKADTRPKN